MGAAVYPDAGVAASHRASGAQNPWLAQWEKVPASQCSDVSGMEVRVRDAFTSVRLLPSGWAVRDATERKRRETANYVLSLDSREGAANQSRSSSNQSRVIAAPTNHVPLGGCLVCLCKVMQVGSATSLGPAPLFRRRPRPLQLSLPNCLDPPILRTEQPITQYKMTSVHAQFPPLNARLIKDTVCLFDVDGTLTPARRVAPPSPVLRAPQTRRQRGNKIS